MTASQILDEEKRLATYKLSGQVRLTPSERILGTVAPLLNPVCAVVETMAGHVEKMRQKIKTRRVDLNGDELGK